MDLDPDLVLAHRFFILDNEATQGYDTHQLKLECVSALEHFSGNKELRTYRKSNLAPPTPDWLFALAQHNRDSYLPEIAAHLLEAAREAPTPELTTRISELTSITTLTEIVHELISDYFPNPE